MAVSDPLADFFTRIRNASLAGHRYVDTPYSILNTNVAEVLKNSKFVEDVSTIEVDGKPMIRIVLKYNQQRKPILKGIDRFSSPGCRQYRGYDEIPDVRNGLGIAILSTSKGVMAGAEARKQKIGGELLCLVW